MIMKLLQLLILFLITMQAFGQSKIPSDTVKIGRASTVVDKGIIFETNDGVNNKKLVIEQSSKLLKFDGNQFRLGDASAGLKDFIFNNNNATNPKLSVDFNADTLIYNKNNMTIGDGIDSDKTFTFDKGGSNAAIKYESSTNRLEFTNDGTVFKAIGSGGGGAGGQNFFQDKNPDAESGLLNWTNTGSGTFVTFSSSPINGDNSFRWDAAAQNDVLRTDQITIPEFFKGKACEINFRHTGGTDDLVKPQVVDSSNVKLPGATYINQVDGTDFLQAQTGIVQRTIFFICPDSGTIAFEFLQTEVGDPAIMDFDDVHIGELIGLQTTVIDEDWEEYTPTLTGFGSPSNIQFFFRRDSTDLLVQGRLTLGTTTAVIAKISLPTGFTIDITKISTSATAKVGFGNLLRSAVQNINTLFSDASDTDEVFISVIGSGSNVYTKSLGTAIGTSADNYTMNIRVPVVENAAQPVKIFLSVPKVAENRNNFSMKGTLAGVVTSENVDWISGDCTDGVGVFTCTFILNIFTLPPSCVVTPNTGNFRGSTIAITNTSFTVKTFDTGGTPSDLDFEVHCSKQGVDDTSPIVQPIFANQVESTRKFGITTDYCRIDNNGTASINDETGLCAKFISLVNRNSTGLVTITFITGVYSILPGCSVSVILPTAAQRDRICNPIQGGSTTSLQVQCSGATNATANDFNFSISCKGAR